MNVLLLAGYRNDDDPANAPGLQVEPTGELRLDRRIDQLKARGLTVICVVSGAGAELQIRRSKRIERVELVFDANAPDVSLVTNIRAGLAAAGKDSCFCLPVEIPWPPPSVWAALQSIAVHSFESVDLVQFGAPGEDGTFGFPLIVTPRARARLKDVTTLTDPRLDYLRPPL